MLFHLERDNQHLAMITSVQMLAGHAALSTIQRCDRERWWTWCEGRTTRAKLALGFDGSNTLYAIRNFLFQCLPAVTEQPRS